MTTAEDAPWIVIAHDGGPRGFWHTIYSGSSEGDALAVFKSNLARYQHGPGGIRLLKDGKPFRFNGPMGKETT